MQINLTTEKMAKVFLKFIIAVSVVTSSTVVLSEDISSCTLKKIPDEQNFCKASFAGSGTFCDIVKLDKKRECHFMVIKIQRNNAYQIKKYEPPKP